MKTWQFPSKSLSEKIKSWEREKGFADKNRHHWLNPCYLSSGIALWPALGQRTTNYLLQHQNTLVQQFGASKHPDNGNIFVHWLIMKWFHKPRCEIFKVFYFSLCVLNGMRDNAYQIQPDQVWFIDKDLSALLLS